MGIYRALIDKFPKLLIIGIDNRPQKNYPSFHNATHAKHFQFIQGDALDPPVDLSQFDFIWASPPCQGYSRLRHLPWLKNKIYPMLIGATRERLVKNGKPFVIENVEDAPLNGAVLCGAALGLELRRHRRFESNKLLLFPPCPGHKKIQIGHGNKTMATKYRGHGIVGIPNRINHHGIIAGHFSGIGWAKLVMGIDWMTRAELAQAIPPAYSEFILRQIFSREPLA